MGNKRMQFVLQHCRKNVLKSDVMHFTTHIQTCLVTSKECCKLCEYRLLDWIELCGNQAIIMSNLHHLLQDKFALGRGKTHNMYRFCCKK